MPAVRGLEPGKRAALVVNELQNAIANPAHVDTPLAAQVTARGIIARINVLTAAFRAAGAPVIYCTIAARTPDWDGFLVNCALAARIKRTGKLVVGTAGGALHDDLVVEPSDIVSHRAHGMAPFTGTTLRRHPARLRHRHGGAQRRLDQHRPARRGDRGGRARL